MSCFDRILRGARPADLPGEEPARFELIMNLKTTRSASQARNRCCWRADEVIEK